MKRTFTIVLAFIAIHCYSQIPEGYYNSAEGLSGEDLKAALHNIIDDHTTYSYTSSSTDVWDILKESDRDPNNSTNVILFYTGWSVNAAQEYNNGSGWSREHVWAKSRGDFGTDRGAGTDCHHLRPADISVNSARSNRWFNYCNEEYYDGGIATGCYTSSSDWFWQPRDEVKGDVARMIFYMATRYEGDVAGEPDLEVIDSIPSDNYTKEPVHAKLEALLQWHIDDPVDDFERNRNEVVYSYQGNRNPFIDHPEYVNSIYGTEDNHPVISDISYNPENPFETEDVTISATITDADGSISSAKVKWGTISGTYGHEVVMTAADDVYSGTIPAQAAGTTIYFVIEAIDNDEVNTTSVENTVSFTSETNDLPQIANVDYNPKNPESTQNVMVSATITDNDGTISTARIKYGSSSGNYPNEVLMTGSTDSYTGIIQARSNGTSIYFIVEATDNESGVTVSSEKNFMFEDPENIAPVVLNVSYSPENPSSENDVTISCEATDADGTIASVLLRWKKGTDGYTDVNMSLTENKYYGQIPAQNEGETVNFVIVAEDNRGLQTSSNGSYQVSESTGLADVDKNEIKIYPNPVSNVLYINIPVNYSVELYSILGEKLMSTKESPVNVSRFKSGVYFILVKTDTGDNLKSIKFLKQ